MSSSDDNNKTWRFLSNDTQVLLCLIRDPNARFRDIAGALESPNVPPNASSPT